MRFSDKTQLPPHVLPTKYQRAHREQTPLQLSSHSILPSGFKAGASDLSASVATARVSLLAVSYIVHVAPRRARCCRGRGRGGWGAVGAVGAKNLSTSGRGESAEAGYGEALASDERGTLLRFAARSVDSEQVAK